MHLKGGLLIDAAGAYVYGRSRNILNRVALCANKMMMRFLIRFEVGGSERLDARDNLLRLEPLEITIHRSQTDSRHLAMNSFINFLHCKVIFSFLNELENGLSLRTFAGFSHLISIDS